jgi:hypothetical protein
MDMLWDVAPPLTWAILTITSLFFLLGFVLLSHTLVRHQAYGDRYNGLLSPGRLEWSARVGTGCLLAGLALWGVELGWGVWPLAGLVLLAGLAFGLEVAARLSDTRRS